MRTIPVCEFKAKYSEIIKQVSLQRKPVIITKYGKPLVKVVPYDGELIYLFGALKGSIMIMSNIVEFHDETWEAESG